jgi:hypothetical protein
MSQFVENERTFNGSVPEIGGAEALATPPGAVGVAGLKGLSGVTRQIGRSACVQHFPSLTHLLQKPQSPSLHWLHFQKHVLADD